MVLEVPKKWSAQFNMQISRGEGGGGEISFMISLRRRSNDGRESASKK